MGHAKREAYDTANAVLLAELVEEAEELDRVGGSLLGSHDLDGNTLLEVDGDVGGLVRSVERRDSLGPHVLGGSDIGVLEHAGLVTAVRIVVVHAVRLGLGRGDGDALLRGVVEQVVAALETLEEGGVTPGGDDWGGE